MKLRKRIMATSAMALITSLTAGTIHAQDVHEPFQLSVLTGAHWTDNRDSRPNEFAEDTFDLRIAPRIAYHGLATETSRTDLYWAPGYRYRTDPSPSQNEGEWYHDLGIDLQRQLSHRLTIVFTEHFNYTDDPAISESGDTIRQDGTFIYNNIYGSAHIRIVKNSQIRISARHRMKDYDEQEVADRSNEEILDANIGYWHAINRRQYLLADVTFQDVDFDTTFDLDRGYGSIAYGVGYEHTLSDRLSATLRAGIRDVDYNDEGTPDNDDPYLTLVGSYNVAEDLRLTGSLYVETREADVFPFSSQDFTGVTLRADKVFNSKFRGYLLGQFRNGEYGEESVPADTPDEAFLMEREGDETTVVFRGNGTWMINPGQELGIYYQYEDTESDVDESYERNEAGLTWFMRF